MYQILPIVSIPYMNSIQPKEAVITTTSPLNKSHSLSNDRIDQTFIQRHRRYTRSFSKRWKQYYFFTDSTLIFSRNRLQ